MSHHDLASLDVCGYSLPMSGKVKPRIARMRTTISSKHQVTIPKQAMTTAGLRSGDRLRTEAAGRGRVLLIREESPVDRHAGTLTGAYQPGELDELRDEWR
ncbi:MAG: AbrB/MazE/SpoVT family DNA-binding domain-containing protein [Candidatus Limnocylindria bacterium]